MSRAVPRRPAWRRCGQAMLWAVVALLLAAEMIDARPVTSGPHARPPRPSPLVAHGHGRLCDGTAESARRQ
jgi:hypothetical protein